MTGVLYLRDPDPTRRQAAVDRALTRLGEMDLSSIADVECGDARVVVGTFAGAPVSTAVDGDRAAVIVGDRFEPGRSVPTTAQELLAGSVDPTAVADGYHLALLIEPAGTLVLTDPLNYFPVHHFCDGEVALVGSSPRLLTAHPACTPRLDLEGIARILLGHAGAEDRTCLAGISRLHFGSRLRVGADGEVRVEPHYRMPTELDARPAPFEELARRMDDRLVAECRRQLDPECQHVLLLSGGLDSRHLGSAARTADRALRAVTFGAPQDFEYQFARRVASTLDIDHELVADRTRTETFERLIRWEGLHCAPALEFGGVEEPAGRLLSGLAFDNLVGGSNIERSYDPVTRTVGVDAFLGRMARRGVGVDGLRSLLRPGVFGVDAADDVLSQFRAEYERSGSEPMTRGWVYAMHHGDRHWVGSELSRHAFRVWPAIPQLSRAMLDVATEVPVGYLGGRRLQRDMVRFAHPDVASIPLDKTNFDTTAIVPQTKDVIRAVAVRRSISLRRALHVPVKEMRYYTRILDFGHPAWIEARRRHESARPLAHELFDAETFDRLLPPPDGRLAESGFPDSNGAKMLLAVMAMLGDGVAV